METVNTPQTVQITPTDRPNAVLGVKSPKPTEVIVTMTNHIELA